MGARRRVCFVLPSLSGGGAERAAVQVVNGLDGARWDFRKHEYQRTHVGRGASLGANCTVVCGHDIGKFAFIGVGSVVTKTVPDYALVVGNPGRVVGWVCDAASSWRVARPRRPQPPARRAEKVTEPPTAPSC